MMIGPQHTIVGGSEDIAGGSAALLGQLFDSDSIGGRSRQRLRRRTSGTTMPITPRSNSFSMFSRG